ncbi:Mut7-C RNAse domain-containing protein [Halapricum hydrolyticum]|uniref:Mut7-C RNAse domain-containing protein n=1 Tax=Halapricum hydrolyticum TaxID=2979991 RepID=A0AAE3IB05_9EURY|nr:Mut7-C RNAse domain-containing protein [Halapricum hydrolyticum]MCU4718413.1 Mut7-C RNAse domain-containing protein [Halapricum hydrolyticum]MCU4726474.1 Mut7-C RNAse domain-containing protein [Halapricum hydrolyticum]
MSRETDRRPALLLDTMLGKLGTYLRMCGYDAAYTLSRGVEDDDEIVALARTEGRTVVTRDVALARKASEAVLIESRDTVDQLREFRDAGFELELEDEPSRCGACNAPLTRVAPEEPTPDYAPEPDYEAVWRCRECGQHFWRGSHWDDVAETLSQL